MNLAIIRVAGAAATAVLVAGCATGATPQSGSQPGDRPGSQSGSQPTTRSATSSSATTVSQTSSPSASPPASSSVPGRPAACAVPPLSASTAAVEGAAGSRYLTIRLTNEGSSSCRMVGYPGVSIVARDRRNQIGAAAHRDTSVRPVAVVLAPRGHTDFVLRVTQALNYPTTTCRPREAYGYRIYPPGSRTALLLADPDLTGCATTAVQLMTVRPVGAPAG